MSIAKFLEQSSKPETVDLYYWDGGSLSIPDDLFFKMIAALDQAREVLNYYESLECGGNQAADWRSYWNKQFEDSSSDRRERE